MASRGFNKVIALGTLTRDPELRHGNSGKVYLFFDLACNYSIKDGRGGYEDAVDYVPFVAFGGLAERISKYCTKGTQLLVEGKLRKNKRQGRDGKDIYETQAVARDFCFAGGKRKDSNGDGYSSGSPYAYDDDGYDPYQGIEEYTMSQESGIQF